MIQKEKTAELHTKKSPRNASNAEANKSQENQTNKFIPKEVQKNKQ